MVDRFLDKDGLLIVWPKKQADKLLALEYLAGKFEIGKTYSESQVNQIIKQWHTFSDWPLLRRELVDRGYMTRDLRGLEYRLA